jgi:Rod binding domain-containing protein
MKIDNNSAENTFKPINNNKNSVESADFDKSKDLKLRAQAEELEAIFLSKLVKAMEKTIPKNESGSTNTLSSMMFSSEMGKAMAKNGGIGLAKIIYNSLKDKDVDLGDELSKINDALNHDKAGMFELDNKVFNNGQ